MQNVGRHVSLYNLYIVSLLSRAHRRNSYDITTNANKGKGYKHDDSGIKPWWAASYLPPVFVLLVLTASGGASSGLLRESGGSKSIGTPVWVPFCWMGAAAIMFARLISVFGLFAGE